MRILKARSRRTLISVALALLVPCAGIAAYGAVRKSHPDDSGAFATPTVLHAHTAGTRKTVNAGVPVRLKIPKIGVDASLEHVSLTSREDLDAPKEPANAGWYDQGPRPGDSGNAIIDGHFGYKNHAPAVFDKLHSLQPGDNIYVEDENGVTTTFVVRATRKYSPNEDASDVFRPNDGGGHLNLITCHGAWNESEKSYATRLVVFSDKQALP
jgi:LPXTG-site transpeptidase (sortase) family protein